MCALSSSEKKKIIIQNITLEAVENNSEQAGTGSLIQDMTVRVKIPYYQ